MSTKSFKKIFAIVTMAATVLTVAYWYFPSNTPKMIHSANGLSLTSFATETSPYYVRSKNQTPYGTYDSDSNTTYLVYPAGITTIDGTSVTRSSAFIRSFNHSTQQWSAPVDVTPEHPTSDAHNVPQLLIDSAGYIHVFHDAHAHESGIVHVRSVRPRDISEWEQQPISNTAGGGYIAAYTAANDDMYLLYRARLDDTSDCTGDACTPEALCTTCYEPEYYIHSSDGGNSWERHIMIDPVKNADAWNTVYVKSIVQDDERNGLHVVFGVHKLHNKRMNNHYYAFFDFTRNEWFSADGMELGETLTQPLYEEHAALYNYNGGRGVVSDGGNARSTIVQYIDTHGYPVIFYSYCDGACTEKGNYIRQIRWNGAEWVDTDMRATFPNEGYIFSINRHTDDDIDLYLRSRIGGDPNIQPRQLPAVIYHFDGKSWSYVGHLFESDPELESRGIRNMSFIPHAHPQIQATMVLPFYGNNTDAGQPYNAPKAIGVHYMMGEDPDQ